MKEIYLDMGVMDYWPGLSYHKLNIYLSADKTVEIRGWIGAVIRNNLLYAASQVPLADGMSLLDWLDRFPLSERHPMYRDLKGGFPKAYSISVHDSGRLSGCPLVLEKGETLAFSLVLIGDAACHCLEFITAIRFMCCRGFGTPMTSFTLLGVYEENCRGRRNRVVMEGCEMKGPLEYSVRLEDFEESFPAKPEAMLRLCLDSPLRLNSPGTKKNRNVSYQDKMNGFPSFYQFVRSAVSRLTNLAVLYSDVGRRSEGGVQVPDENELEDYLDEAASALLIETTLRRRRLKGPLRKGNRLPMCFPGYTGELLYVGNFNRYLPLLAFMQALGNGNDTVYGLGAYHFEIDQ